MEFGLSLAASSRLNRSVLSTCAPMFLIRPSLHASFLPPSFHDLLPTSSVLSIQRYPLNFHSLSSLRPSHSPRASFFNAVSSILHPSTSPLSLLFFPLPQTSSSIAFFSSSSDMGSSLTVIGFKLLYRCHSKTAHPLESRWLDA